MYIYVCICMCVHLTPSGVARNPFPLAVELIDHTVSFHNFKSRSCDRIWPVQHALFPDLASSDLNFCHFPPSLSRSSLREGPVRSLRTFSFHNFKSQNFKLSVSNPKSKYVAYLSVLSQISNCQGLGRKNKH